MQHQVTASKNLIIKARTIGPTDKLNNCTAECYLPVMHKDTPCTTSRAPQLCTQC